jgi:hypothetical protein
METQYIVLLIGILFGLGVGIRTEQSSNRREPVYGGGSARFFHYLMSATASAMPVTIIACAITGGLLFAVYVALSLAATLWTSALIFATVERPAREVALAQKAAAGWTEEDARTSGL